MEKEYAEEIAKVITGCAKDNGRFRIDEEDHHNPLLDFHQWTKEKDSLGAFLIRRYPDGVAYWLVLIEWNPTYGYYLVIFPEDKSSPLAEIHQLQMLAFGPTLLWDYSPTKRDKKNELRKDYFSRYFFSTNVKISLPESGRDVAPFLKEVFSLVECRVKADSLDNHAPETRDGFPEGKRVEALHRRRERNPDVVKRAKLLAKNKYGRLLCQCCGFDFEETYGPLGADFIEAHHTKSLSNLPEEGAKTEIEDLALVCANCHRMLHRKRPWLEMDKLSQLIKK